MKECPACKALVYEHLAGITKYDEDMNYWKYYTCVKGHFFQEKHDVFGKLLEYSYDKPFPIME
jgi:hypothetical protein